MQDIRYPEEIRSDFWNFLLVKEFGRCPVVKRSEKSVKKKARGDDEEAAGVSEQLLT